MLVAVEWKPAMAHGGYDGGGQCLLQFFFFFPVFRLCCLPTLFFFCSLLSTVFLPLCSASGGDGEWQWLLDEEYDELMMAWAVLVRLSPLFFSLSFPSGFFSCADLCFVFFFFYLLFRFLCSPSPLFTSPCVAQYVLHFSALLRF